MKIFRMGTLMTTKESVKQKTNELVEKLKTQRDELDLKIHLANMEVQDEWRVVEDKWQHLHAKGAQVEEAVGSSAQEIGEAMSLLADEIRQSYKRIRKAL